MAIVDELKRAGGSLRVLEPPISTDDPITGDLLIHLLGIVSTLEAGFLKERQRVGIQYRRELDRSLPLSQRAYRGRPRTVDVDAIRKLKAEGMGVVAISKAVGVSRMTVYRSLA